ncbi:protein of unknown function [Rhodovastum atsumiense]|nr:protein of unknown function [Rhodovastum atsumiense]
MGPYVLRFPVLAKVSVGHAYSGPARALPGRRAGVPCLRQVTNFDLYCQTARGCPVFY